jgi:hypothetical protein
MQSAQVLKFITMTELTTFPLLVVAAGAILTGYLIRSAKSPVMSQPTDQASAFALATQKGTRNDRAEYSKLSNKAPEAKLVTLTNENRAMFGAIVPRQGQWWFYKFVGDAPAVNAEREAFVQFAKSQP